MRERDACGLMGLLASLFVTTLTTSRVDDGSAQQLILTADVGKTEFFEGEPIFLLVRLANLGLDTAWVSDFALVSPAVDLSVRRRDGKPVPVGGLIADTWYGAKWRGDPVAPGRSLLSAEALQFHAGDEREYRRSLFPKHLAPGEYELRVRFHAHWAVAQAQALTLEAPAISFRIREGTAAEESEVKELEAIRSMAWDHFPMYEVALIKWVARHQGGDPFLPFLLSSWLYEVEHDLERTAATATTSNLDTLRAVVLEAQKHFPAGAHMMQTMVAWHPEQLPALAERLGASYAGEMARYHLERILYAERFKKQHSH